MRKIFSALLILWAALVASGAFAETTTVLDVPTRPDVTQRLLLITPDQPRATLVLFTGGNGALKIAADGKLGAGSGNFLIRTRQQWADKGFVVALVDAPSDRQNEPYLSGVRQTPEHLADIKAVIAALRQRIALPVWLVGTSRGTQSVAFVASALSGADAPDGVVLTSSILTDPKSRSVPDMPLERIAVPVLVVHHQQDACKVCKPEALPGLMSKLTHSPRRELLQFEGGIDKGDPCEAFAYHGYNGIESRVVDRITNWILP